MPRQNAARAGWSAVTPPSSAGETARDDAHVKLFLGELAEVLEQGLTAAEYRLFLWFVCHQARYSGGSIVTGSKERLASQTGLKRATLYRALVALQRIDLIRAADSESWRVNPRVIHMGHTRDRATAVSAYDKLPGPKAKDSTAPSRPQAA
ncbi:hypothetical protein [Streptomyces sp. NPDC054958]